MCLKTVDFTNKKWQVEERTGSGGAKGAETWVSDVAPGQIEVNYFAIFLELTVMWQRQK